MPMPTRSFSVPPLAHGYRLTRNDFERRWDAMPNLKVAELIDGVVYLPEIGSHLYHGQLAAHIIGWSGTYVTYTRGTEGGCHPSLKLDDLNEPQPDLVLMVKPSHGGQARLDDEGFLVTVPDCIGEVCPDSASYDLHVKLDLYRRQGVKEYIVWRVRDRAIDWLILRGDEYERMEPSRDGIYRSEVFPGLWLDAQAMLGGRLAVVFQVAKLGLASPEHQQFVEHLARQATRS